MMTLIHAGICERTSVVFRHCFVLADSLASVDKRTVATMILSRCKIILIIIGLSACLVFFVCFFFLGGV